MAHSQRSSVCHTWCSLGTQAVLSQTSSDIILSCKSHPCVGLYSLELTIMEVAGMAPWMTIVVTSMMISVVNQLFFIYSGGPLTPPPRFLDSGAFSCKMCQLIAFANVCMLFGCPCLRSIIRIKISLVDHPAYPGLGLQTGKVCAMEARASVRLTASSGWCSSFWEAILRVYLVDGLPCWHADQQLTQMVTKCV